MTIGGRTLTIWKDVAPTGNGVAEVSAPTVFVGDGSDTTIDVRGKVAVATLVAPPAASVRSTTNTYEVNYTRAAITPMSQRLSRRGAAAVILVADSIGEIGFDGVATVQMRGAYDVVGGVPRFNRAAANATAAGAANANGGRGGRGGGRGAGAAGGAPAPVLLVHRSALNDLRNNGQPVEIRLRDETFESPSVNIIGVVPGTDPNLRNEYVLFSTHQDHDGVRYIVAGDSIWNGADDNASTSVALLAIARAWVKQPSKRRARSSSSRAPRSAVYSARVIYVAHPMVPLTSIAAVLNGDMIGRNSRRYRGAARIAAAASQLERVWCRWRSRRTTPSRTS